MGLFDLFTRPRVAPDPEPVIWIRETVGARFDFDLSCLKISWAAAGDCQRAVAIRLIPTGDQTAFFKAAIVLHSICEGLRGHNSRQDAWFVSSACEDFEESQVPAGLRFREFDEDPNYFHLSTVILSFSDLRIPQNGHLAAQSRLLRKRHAENERRDRELARWKSSELYAQQRADAEAQAEYEDLLPPGYRDSTD